MRIATYNADFTALGPGLLLRDLIRGQTPQYEAAIAVIAAIDADVLLITAMDYDLRGEALAALADRLVAVGQPYAYRMALRPNTGVATGIDLDGNGRLGEPRDAMGYGRFAGEGGMAILSRLPMNADEVRDFSSLLWADFPGNLMPANDPARTLQTLSTTGHYEVPVALPGGKTLRLLAYYATPPVFDGPEDRNGRRNHDETAFWLKLIDGALPYAPPEPPFVILGQSSLDPADGEGRAQAIRALLHHPALQDPAPRGQSTHVDKGQTGDPALDTAVYPGIGGLRVEVILPSADLRVSGAAVLWPKDGDSLIGPLTAASRHYPVWVDIDLP